MFWIRKKVNVLSKEPYVHICFTKDGRKKNLFLDGKRVGSREKQMTVEVWVNSTALHRFVQTLR